MSCNGCRVLRKGCSESCALRHCLQWIKDPEAQAHATVFLAKYFGRSTLMSFISAVPEIRRPALLRSLLYEACGRAVNPVDGVVGLIWTGNWNLCQMAVETVLCGGYVQPILHRNLNAEPKVGLQLYVAPDNEGTNNRSTTRSMDSEECMTTNNEGNEEATYYAKEQKLLNLFL